VDAKNITSEPIRSCFMEVSKSSNFIIFQQPTTKTFAAEFVPSKVWGNGFWRGGCGAEFKSKPPEALPGIQIFVCKNDLLSLVAFSCTVVE
jgi:hypothetical protein